MKISRYSLGSFTLLLTVGGWTMYLKLVLHIFPVAKLVSLWWSSHIRQSPFWQASDVSIILKAGILLVPGTEHTPAFYCLTCCRLYHHPTVSTLHAPVSVVLASILSAEFLWTMAKCTLHAGAIFSHIYYILPIPSAQAHDRVILFRTLRSGSLSPVGGCDTRRWGHFQYLIAVASTRKLRKCRFYFL